VADHQHQQQRTEKDEADERAEEAAEMGREDQHHTPPPPKSSVEGSANASGGAGMRRASKRKSAAATARLDDTDPEEARQREEEEEVRRLQQLRLERAEMGRGHGEDDRPRAREERKKCLAYCTADAYVLHKLYRALRADDVIAAEWKISYIRRDRKYIRLRCLDDSEIYIFPFGSFVCWDVDDADFIRVRQLIRACERGERTELYEDFDFAYGRDTAVDPEDDELILKEDDSTAKWPVSFALAQSIKLDYFEKEVKDTFQEMQALSHYLARNGSIPLGPKKIVQEMGKIMELLVNVNLGETDFVSDIPDEFWEDSESANTWKIFNSHLGVKNRAKVHVFLLLSIIRHCPVCARAHGHNETNMCVLLSRRVDGGDDQVLDSQLKMFNDFYSMLSSEVHVKKSTRLEWAIIFLISIEVVFGVADHSDWLASFIP
jgi:uncharacterized Rmd1/YagE family protein